MTKRRFTRRTLLFVPAWLLLLILLTACGTSGQPASPVAPADGTSAVPGASLAAPETVPPAAEPTTGPKTSAAAFTVAVIVDSGTQTVSHDQAAALVNEAGALLRQLTPFGLEMVDYSEDSAGGSTNDMASRYVRGQGAALPNGIVILSRGDGDQAKATGGYGYGLTGPEGFHNTFVSPVMGANQVYVAVVDVNFRYAACGYGGAETVQAATALAGECRNKPGTACVQQNGYSMCADAVGNLYMSTPTYYAASMIVHELLHPFAANGELDHYNTPECNARMGYPAAFFDLQESQYHNDLCPNVYEAFVQSHQP